MKINSIQAVVEKLWDQSVLPVFKTYIRIPALSPAFAPDWRGNLEKAVDLAAAWCREMALDGVTIRKLSEPERTPALLMEVHATNPEDTSTTLFYGHLDKQPEADGWDPGKGPWLPVLENNRLYGRGSVDDGYAVFSAMTALKALQANRISHGRCVILIETGEESGSPDLPYYLEAHADIIGSPDLVVCLDASCGDWDRLWMTTSLRGIIEGRLSASLLTQSVHSGGSGLVADSFRILRRLLDRIEDPCTGNIRLKALHTQIPSERLQQIRQVAGLLGKNIRSDLPLVPGGQLMGTDIETLLINSTWQPALTVIGADGIPPGESAGNVLRPVTGLTLSLRTPPGINTGEAAQALKNTLEENPPYGAAVRFEVTAMAGGWDMPDSSPGLQDRIQQASQTCFGNAPGFIGEGGTIPFMTLLADKFPAAKFLVTGALGPKANAHGPNEFLDLPYVKKLTSAIAMIIAA